MAGRILGRLMHAWNAFTNPQAFQNPGEASTSVGYYRPDRARLSFGNERSILSGIYTRLSMDVAAWGMKHVRVDDNDRYVEDLASGLNACLTVQANVDQAATEFRQDIALTLFDKGVAAIVPIDTTLDPNVTGAYDILTMRVGEVTSWHPTQIRANVYNEAVGYRQQITLSKDYVAIVTNPLHAIMNEPNSTLQRLIRKLNLLDAIDEQSASGKLDLIIQLPYTIKSEARREQAKQRRADMEEQLKGSKYGIAYSDATEKIVQLNRPSENNLLAQVEYLMNMLYGQLGLTPEIMNGTADEKTMNNYHNRTIKPIVKAIIEAMRRSFLTKTGRSQGQDIKYFRDIFELIPFENLHDLIDSLSRNEVATPNDVRVEILGWKPSKDPNADKLQNSNMPQPGRQLAQPNAQPQPRIPATVGPRAQLTAAPSEPPTQR